MSRFVFRAQAALEVRRRRHDQAQRTLAAAELSVRAAREALASAEQRLRDDLTRATTAEAEAADATILGWYRNWLSGRRREIAKCGKTLEAREGQARHARSDAVRAHRELKSLERLRERARCAFLVGERRAEQKALDSLGTLQHARRANEAKEEL
ncbi:MAG: flagellar FliJ family protein [Acidobacteria bacterium]|nr:flagellar FliJ family protein [Acidobacteriota bacterium]